MNQNNESNPSETPRTDEAELAPFPSTEPIVSARFARTLERELTAQRAATEEARKERDANARLYFEAKQVEIPELNRTLEAVRKENEDLRGRLEKIQRGDS